MSYRISCVYATARPSMGAMIGRENVDHIKQYLDCLAKQTLPPDEFEVIIADCYYNRRENHVRNNTYRGVKYPFNIIHFQVKSPWLDRGCWAGQAPWNQSAMLASGELLVLFGDCCEPPPKYLERIWRWYERGYWALGLVIYKMAGRLFYYEENPQVGKLTPVGSLPPSHVEKLRELKRRGIIKDLVRDSRWFYVEQEVSGILKLKGRAGAQQFHGYSSIPLRDLLKLNGFDENFDGDKALGDVDLGIRLYKAGYDKMLVLDKDIWIYENAHYSVPRDLLFYEGPSIRSNYSLLMLNELKGRWRANSYRLTDEEVDWICQHARDWGFREIDQRANPLFQAWLKNPPIFDLQDLRWEVQQKLEGEVEVPSYYVWKG